MKNRHLVHSSEVDGWDTHKHTVHVGDWVGFKSDIEQSGRIAEIWRDSWGYDTFILTNDDGFEGHYIGGQTLHTIRAKDCWVG